MRPCLVPLLILAAAPTLARALPIRLAATPALSPDGQTLAFEWRKDIWLAPTTGGVARALTHHEAVDRFPVFSPDGRSLAFYSERDGTGQVWRMDLPSGTPRPLTFHAEGAIPQDWSPDGKTLLVRATRDSGDFRPQRFYLIDATTGGKERLVFDAHGDSASFSPDGSRILWSRDGDDPYRRGYRGSKAATVWSYDIAGAAFQPLARAESGADCRWPLWKADGSGIFFVRETDHGRCFNLWHTDFASGLEAPLTTFNEDPVRFPCRARNGSLLVFRAGVDFYRLDPAAGAGPQRIDLQAPADTGPDDFTRLTYVSAVNYDEPACVRFSPDGKEVVFTSGGTLWVMDTQIREPVALTTGSGHQDNWATFSANADRIWFLRDTGDRANLWQAERANPALPWWRNTSFVLTPLTDDTRARRMLLPDPSRRRLCWNETMGQLWVGTPGSNDATRVATSTSPIHADWSPDGKWLVCGLENGADVNDVWIVAADGKTPPYNLTRQPDWAGGPMWSPDGRGIAYISRAFDGKVSLHHVWLRKQDHALTEREHALAAPGDAPKETRIDFDGLSARVRKLTLNVSSPSDLFWSWDGKALGFKGSIDGKSGTWKTFAPNFDRSEFLTGLRGEWTEWRKSGVLWAVDGVPHELEKKLPFTVRLTRDDVAWRRLGFRKMWRAMRDEFYDARANNLDWDGVLARYEPLVVQIDEAAFQRLASMLFGELNASHLDYTPAKSALPPGVWKRVTGHPGVRFDASDPGPGLRVAEVIPEGPADREVSRLLPGDRINGVESLDELNRRCEGPLPRELVLDVTRDGSNRVVRIPLMEPDDLRKLARTAEEREARRRVEEWSGGRAGYLVIRGMQTENLRQFEEEVVREGHGREGLVIDVRNNTGGFTADSILNILLYPRHALTVVRNGEPAYQGGYLRRPMWTKPITVLCNAYTASNGEIFSHAIKHTGRGRLVGVPTQGAVIATDNRKVLDLGEFRVPLRGWFSLPSGIDMDRRGAQPDLVVENPPGTRAAGQDPQLRAAVDALLEDIAKAPRLPALRYGSGRTVQAE